MKRFTFLIAIALVATVSVGYSDSHVIKKESIQVDRGTDVLASVTIHQVFSAELPVALVVNIPDLGSPASNYVMVSEELTDVPKMRIRPPPEKVQKSEYKRYLRV